jgi:hypothetical protein
MTEKVSGSYPMTNFVMKVVKFFDLSDHSVC